MDHHAMLERIMEWAHSDHNIRAVVLTGSLARESEGSVEVDAESDLDVELYATTPELLLQSTLWYHQFGEVIVVEALENPDWHPTRLVYYADGKIDFMIAPVTVLNGNVTYDRPYRL
jgi:aminoglycoside 6-adenylyltransferase